MTLISYPQLVKKVAQSGDTACLQHTLDIFHHEDLQLLQGHCHARALSILRARPGGSGSEAHTREAIAYLSLAIFAAGRNLCQPQGSNPVPDARGTRGICERACPAVSCTLEPPGCGRDGTISQEHLVLEPLAVHEQTYQGLRRAWAN